MTGTGVVIAVVLTILTTGASWEVFDCFDHFDHQEGLIFKMAPWRHFEDFDQIRPQAGGFDPRGRPSLLQD